MCHRPPSFPIVKTFEWVDCEKQKRDVHMGVKEIIDLLKAILNSKRL